MDGAGHAFVAGWTESTDFPVTPGAFQTTNHASHTGCDGQCSTAFVTELNATGTGLVYSTYLGGSDWDEANGVAVDGAGHAFVAGVTVSTDFPVTPGAFQTSKHGPENAFVTELNAAGTGLAYSTYLGGSVNRLGLRHRGGRRGRRLRRGRDVLLGLPVTPGAFQTTCPGAGGPFGCSEAFATELNAAGAGLVYGTYLGGSDGDWAYGVAVDGAGHAFVAGATYFADFPVTPGAFQTTNHAGGCCNAFVTELTMAGGPPQNPFGTGSGQWGGGPSQSGDTPSTAVGMGRYYGLLCPQDNPSCSFQPAACYTWATGGWVRSTPACWALAQA